MARRIKDNELGSRQAREKLRPRGKPYWRSLEKGLHIGYRRMKGKAGSWSARHYIGKQQYEIEAIGTADDFSDADGVVIFDFWQAQNEARARMVSRARQAHGKTGPLTVREAVEEYLGFLETNRKSGHDARLRMEAFVYPELGEFELEKLTTDRLERWHAALAKMPARVRTKPGDEQQHRITNGDEASRQRRVSANRVLSYFKAALNRAWRRGNVTSDAAWRRVEPFENVDRPRLRYLTVVEATRLVNAASPGFRPLLQAALCTGARYGELTELRASDFNPDSGTVHVRTSKSGKGRHIVLDEEGAALFKAWSAGKPGNALLFTKRDGSAWSTSHQGAPMIEACDRAKIKPRISFHGLRHTWASLAVMNAVPLMIVAKNLGHADTRMVERHYGHLAPSYVADAIRKGAPKFGFKPDSNVVGIGARR